MGSQTIQITQLTQNPVTPDHPSNPNHPVNPNNPTTPTNPGQSGHGSQGSHPWAGHPGYTINAQGQIVGPDGKIYKKGQLPQTGNTNSELSALGLGLLGVTSLFGLGLKRRKEDQ